jgi:hypothetical protein
MCAHMYVHKHTNACACTHTHTHMHREKEREEVNIKNLCFYDKLRYGCILTVSNALKRVLRS